MTVSHETVLLQESVDALNVRSGGCMWTEPLEQEGIAN